MERSYVAKATQPRRRILQSRILFHDIGKFSLSYIIKSASHGDAHSHERQMSAKADHARRSKSVLLGRKWNRKGVRSTLLFYVHFLRKRRENALVCQVCSILVTRLKIW